MNTDGILRRLDKEGRIVVPKEMRNSIGVQSGECLEIFYNRSMNLICLKKYNPQQDIASITQDLSEMVQEGNYTKHKELEDVVQNLMQLIKMLDK